MPTLTLEIPPATYQKLDQEATRLNQSIHRLILDELAKKFCLPLTDHETIDQALKAAGLLSELGPRLQHRAKSATMTLPEIIHLMSSTEGQSLTDILLEQRTAKPRFVVAASAAPQTAEAETTNQ